MLRAEQSWNASPDRKARPCDPVQDRPVGPDALSTWRFAPRVGTAFDARQEAHQIDLILSPRRLGLVCSRY